MSLSFFTDRRLFLIVLSAVGIVAFTALALLPGSPGQDRLATWLAVAISTANLLAAVLLTRIRPGAHRLLVFSSVLAVTIALGGSDSGRDSDLYLLWYFWIAAYAAMVSRLRVALLHALVVSAGAVLGVALKGDLYAGGAAAVMAIVTIVATTLVTFWVGRWNHLLVVRDLLTGLANRAGLAHVAQPAIAQAVATGRYAVLVLLDINRFREVNDALGHPAGDRLLQVVARQLRNVATDPALVGRLGGDEFAVVLCGLELSDEPAAAHEHLRAIGRTVIRQLRGPFRIDGVDVEVEASAGVAAAPMHGTTLGTLLPAADAALHAAGRESERVGVWDAGMGGVRPWELALHAQLRAAITGGELVLHYQPLLSCQTGRIAGVEALLRWAHPSRGLLAPGAFLPMAERSTLIIDLTEWVLDEALRQCADWARAGEHIPVSVNLSARMLVRDNLPDLVSETLGRHGLPADVLTLEITESALVTQPARAAAMLRELRTRGIKLSLDDFGTGYSSMEILKTLPFDEVKIDKGFVSDAHGSLPDAAIVRSVLELGHRLGLRVVGEGVEDDRAMRMLMELGCDLLQGDAISSPLPPSAHLLTVLRAGAGEVSPAPVGAAGPRPGGAARPGGTEPGAAASDSAPAAGGGPAAAEPVAAALATAGGLVPEEASGASCGLAPARGPRAGGGPGPGPGDTEPLAALTPADEPARRGAPPGHKLLEPDRDDAFDEIATLAARLCATPVAFVAFRGADRQWRRACYGSTATELPREALLDLDAPEGSAVVEIPDIAGDPRFARLAALGPSSPFRFYAAAPIRTPDHTVIGHVAVLDRVARALTPGQKESLAALGRQSAHLLAARRAVCMVDQVTTALGALDRFWYPDHLDPAVSLVAEVSRSLLDADAVSLLLADIPGSTVFHVAASATRPDEDTMLSPGARFTESDETGIGTVLRTRAPVFFPDVSTSRPFPHQVVRRPRIASALLVPIPGEGGLIGLVAACWAATRTRVDQAGLRAVTLLGGQAGHTLARLRTAQVRVREIGVDPDTGLTSRDRFLTVLQGLPAGTAVCLFGVPDHRQGEAFVRADEYVLRHFAAGLRAAAGAGVELARWSHNRFVAALPADSNVEPDTLLTRLRSSGDIAAAAPFAVGVATTRPDQPPSAALHDAEGSLRDALHATSAMTGRAGSMPYNGAGQNGAGQNGAGHNGAGYGDAGHDRAGVWA
ncbi:EAL domain-containing protein [Protofrankia sp. BMG5.30]|uniref:EAL domain-containing protein n=3 Tax=Protofrankia TaxID=2994361 RepID=UPI001588AE4D|nr:EAL domain-containing protein [Protofrankia sp. BMG5.30]